MEEIPLPQAKSWAETMSGHTRHGIVTAHADSCATFGHSRLHDRVTREEFEALTLRPGAARAAGSGNRVIAEEPDPMRTCFERDRDRIVHSSAFRRLAGKTQVVVFPRDHQRTRLTHAIEVAQCATSIARGLQVNVALTDAIALGHDCGHGPGGHAAEDAFAVFLTDGYDHAVWGADVVLTELNLCAETLDGIRNHSWSRPAPQTIEGEIVSWADRIAYCAHDLEDAIQAGVVGPEDLPQIVREVAGTTRREQLTSFITAIVRCSNETGQIAMDETTAEALAALRAFNHERIYTRPDSVAQSIAVIRVLRSLVEFYIEHPAYLPAEYVWPDLVRGAVAYVGGMTDRFAFEQAVELLAWDIADLPQGVGRGA